MSHTLESFDRMLSTCITHITRQLPTTIETRRWERGLPRMMEPDIRPAIHRPLAFRSAGSAENGQADQDHHAAAS